MKAVAVLAAIILACGSMLPGCTADVMESSSGGTSTPSTASSSTSAPGPSREESIDKNLDILAEGVDVHDLGHEREWIYLEEATSWKKGEVCAVMAHAARYAIQPALYDLAFPSPDGKYILKAIVFSFVPICYSTRRGIPYRNVQFIESSSGAVLWTGEIDQCSVDGGCEIYWSADSRHAAINQTNQHLDTVSLLDTKGIHWIDLPGLEEVKALAGEEDRIYFEPHPTMTVFSV